MSGTPDVHVVHLVRRGNPPEALERFLESYRRHDPGLAHRLVLLRKGYGPGDAPPATPSCWSGLPGSAIDVPDDGFDLTAYRRAADRLDGVLCFLNSNSVLLAPGWLSHLVGALRGDVGIAGASGSWASGRSNIRFSLHLPGPYTAVFPDRAWYREVSSRLSAAGPPDGRLSSRPPLRYVRTASQMALHYAWFRSFPAPHVRTNAFASRSETIRRVAFPPLRSKIRAWRLESGRGSITEQLAAMGLGGVVVGRDGRAFRSEEWADSATFWQDGQENLLVADNQTEMYASGDLELRTLLAKAAWGLRARPAPPPERLGAPRR